MQTIRTVIIDDERLARQRCAADRKVGCQLLALLAGIGQLRLVGLARAQAGRDVGKLVVQRLGVACLQALRRGGG